MNRLSKIFFAGLALATAACIVVLFTGCKSVVSTRVLNVAVDAPILQAVVREGVTLTLQYDPSTQPDFTLTLPIVDAVISSAGPAGLTPVQLQAVLSAIKVKTSPAESAIASAAVSAFDALVPALLSKVEAGATAQDLLTLALAARNGLAQALGQPTI